MNCKHLKNLQKICVFLLFFCVFSPVFASELPLIMLDPGHGGNDPGATARNGLDEKHITLQFARILKAEIEAAKIARVELTRTKDIFVTIENRVAIARKAKANLMISVHADSLAENPFLNARKLLSADNASIRGATFYTLSETATDVETAAYAERENKADKINWQKIEQNQPIIDDILIDLTTRETRALSHHFANLSIDEIKPIVKLTKIPHRSAKFRVLKSPDVPSVLFEMGYLSSNDDTKLLSSDVWQKAVAQKLVAALKRYFVQAVIVPVPQRHSREGGNLQ